MSEVIKQDLKTEALKLALDWYDSGNENPDDFANMIKQVIALAQQPAQGCDYCNNPQYAGTKCKNCGREQPAQQQEPPTVAELLCVCGAEWEWRNRDWELVATPPASKPWVGLTDDEIDECYYWKDRQWTTDELVRHVEAKLRMKNA